jgi:predicted RNase H-like nuclease (RuvC/YqgF family)
MFDGVDFDTEAAAIAAIKRELPKATFEDEDECVTVIVNGRPWGEIVDADEDEDDEDEDSYDDDDEDSYDSECDDTTEESCDDEDSED